MNIGLTSVTFRDKSIAEVIKISKNASMNCLECGTDVHLTDINKCKEIASLCKIASLNVVTIGSYYKVGAKDFEKFKNLCEMAKILNAKNIRLWLGDKSSKLTDNYQQTALKDEIIALSRFASIYNLTISFEFHKNTYNDNAKTCVAFLKELNLSNVKTLWQPFGNSNKDLNNLKLLLPYLSEIHIFQWNKVGKRFPLKKGKRFWKKVFTILKEHNFNGNYIMEFVKNDNEEIFYKDAKFLLNLLSKIQTKEV